MADTRAYLQEVVTNIRVVKSFVAELYEASRLKEIISRLVKINLRYGVFKHIEEPISAAVNAVINVSILLFAANELFQGNLTTSGFFLYLYVGKSILTPLTTLTETYNNIQRMLATGERVQELFGEPVIIEPGPEAVLDFQDAIELNDVSFRYDDDLVIEAVNLQIRRGEIVALVGPSGAGKSTLTDLILRFYDPQKGNITFDGRDLREIDLDAYRRLFGVVAQDSQLFNTTIAENIAYSMDDAAIQDIRAAAEVANAHEFIQQLPDAYQTLVGDRGVRLSGGQRQRVAIARAVVRKPQILILDEATSSLDSESEKLVQDAIDRVIENTTAIIVAHRLSTVVHADKIVVLNEGRLEDQGRHEELLQRCDLYRHLCELQFGLENLPRLSVG
jgi:subfamily B ATP-binding cassette protein MsbA